MIKIHNIKIRELNKEDFSEWDRLVDRSPQGTPFHYSQWLSTCDNVLLGEHKILGCYLEKELIAGCPIRINYIGPFKMSKAFNPFTNYYNGIVIKPLSDNTKVRKTETFTRSIIESLSAYFQFENFSFLRFVNSPSLVDIRAFTNRGWIGKITYTYYLSLESLNFKKEFSRDIRRNIKKAEDAGIEIIRSKDIDEYIRLFKSTLQRQRSRSLPQIHIINNFLEEIIPILYKNSFGEMWLAKTSSDEIASGIIFLFDNKRSI